MAKPIKGLTAALQQSNARTVPVGQIRWLLGRVHVSTSYLDVARDIVRRSRCARVSKKPIPWPIVRAMIRVAVREHRSNRRLYHSVMTGRF